MNNKNTIIYVGMDVHKESITFAAIRDDEPEPFVIVKKRNERSVILKYFNKLKEKGELICVYEAGPCGYHLFRFLQEISVPCIIAAPSMLPKKPGLHIKTDKRDAKNLAKTLRAGDATPIYIPTVADEAVRDYLRMRDDIKQDLKCKKQQILSLVNRHGLKFEGSSYWTLKHRKWLKNLSFPESLRRETLDEYYLILLELEEKLIRIEARIAKVAEQEQYIELVGKLRCFKGIDTLTALSFVIEIGDFKRFLKAENFMAFLGLVPGEATTGERRIQLGITKAGNSHLRKLLIESAWHYNYYQPSKRLRARRKDKPLEIVAYTDKAGRRLNNKYRHMIYLGKQKQVAVTAVAREFAGFIWGMAMGKTA